jgi:glucosamine-6-phosphate deaminase
MTIDISPDKQELGRRAADKGAQLIREAITAKGHANIIVATGASQFEMLQHLVKAEAIDWSKVTAFHLDEYVGMSITHPASFRKYLQERFVAQLPQTLAGFHPISGEGDTRAECARLHELISAAPIDVAFVGIGENGHLAFNDPPADFEVEDAYIVVDLDEACRRQQMGEGWFPTLEDVPQQAISMSIKQILKSATIIVSAPDERKAQAIKDNLTGDISPNAPSSVLQNHPATYVYLDEASASKLPKQ